MSATTAPSLSPTELVGMELSENARRVLTKRYLRRGSDGQTIESIEEMIRRVASHVASVEGEWGAEQDHYTKVFINLIASRRFLPNSPTFTGAGTPLGQLAACFVLPISDDMGRSPSGIFRTLLDAALIQQTGGGNGFSFSRLRPKGTIVKTSSGKATGPVGFLRVYDQAFGEVAQGGFRRGANMAVLRVDHPDIEEFITCKTDESSITNFNISVGITDSFMEAVLAGKDWELRFPDVLSPDYANFDGTINEAEKSGIPIKTHKTVRARRLWDLIIKHAHLNGEPGALFLDAMNRSNPLPHLYEIEATNPCGEQNLGPYESCCLGSINLGLHATSEGGVDWVKLGDTVQKAVRFLDNVVEVNHYVREIPRLQEAAQHSRRIGLGIMGLADLLYLVGIRYGSEESMHFSELLMEHIRYHAMMASVNLAKEREAFPSIRGSIYDPANLSWSPPKATDVNVQAAAHRPTPDWSKVVKGMKSFGIRNAAQLSIAPTGTLSTVAGCEGYGCEPVFALAYHRRFQEDGKSTLLTYTSPLFEKALSRAGIEEQARERILAQVVDQGSCQNIQDIPNEIHRVFVVSQDITPEEHVRMQAALQKFTDNAISKTVNLPSTATTEDVSRVLHLAWETGCKGVTVYVMGSRKKEVLETHSSQYARGQIEKGKSAEISRSDQEPWQSLKKPRPEALPGVTIQKETPVGKTFVTINTNSSGQPFEVFINTAKAGSETAAISEALGRLISYILRMASPLEPRKRLEEVHRQLWGIGGARPRGFGKDRVRSLPDALSQVLGKYLDLTLEGPQRVYLGPQSHEQDNVPLPNPVGGLLDADLCPSCGEASLVYEEGMRDLYELLP